MADESLHLRVAARFLRAGYFAVGDLVWQGKYKNKLGIITAFGVDAKGNPTITVSPIPKGRKQDKTFSLFKVWKVRPEQIEDLKAKGKIAASRELEVPDPLPAYVPSAKKPTLFTREDGIEIAGGLWQDAQSSSSGPVPQLAFVARFGPEAAPKLRKKNPGNDSLGSLTLYPRPDEPGTFWVGQVAVSPKLQRMGIATDLYREAVKWLRQHGGKLQHGDITSQAAAKMWEKWREQGLAEGKYLKMDKWAEDDDWNDHDFDE